MSRMTVSFVSSNTMLFFEGDSLKRELNKPFDPWGLSEIQMVALRRPK
jgi:hypothetical protein